jgi:hypothetical protein
MANDGWNDAPRVESFSPEAMKIGDTLTGRLIDIEERDYKDDQTGEVTHNRYFIVKTVADGEVKMLSVRESADMRRRVFAEHIGMGIRFTFEGETESKMNGGSPKRMFNIQFKKLPNAAPAAAPKQEEELPEHVR